MPVDPSTAVALTRTVQDALAEEASSRSANGELQLTPAAQEALAIRTLRAELRRLDEAQLAAGRPRLTDAEEEAIESTVLATAVGRGPFDLMLADESVEDIAATKFDMVFTYHSDGSVRRVRDQYWSSPQELSNSLSHIARTQGRTERQFNAQHPLLTMRIGRGLRLAAQRDVSEHVSFTLRRNTLGKVTMGDLVGREMFPQVLGDLFVALGQAPEMRTVIGGATGAGKTTLSRAILNEQDALRRIVVVEDTAELDLYDDEFHPNVESWEERLPNSEGEGGVTVGELVKHGLRNRPDLLIVGEVRGADAAIPMLEAMTHGQASLTTVHADDAQGMLRKLALFLGKGEDAMNREAAHDNLSQAIDFLVHVDRGNDGRRYVSEVVEVSGFDGTQVTTNTIYEAGRDGAQQSMHRMSDQHVRKLRRVGFDPDRLGSAWR